MGTIREPIKENSIAKKAKIIKIGFDLMCEKGYHNVTCVDIAQTAQVSTGIIYQYFHDKHDIFVAGVKSYAKSIMFPVLDFLDQQTITKKNLPHLIATIIDKFIDAHTIKKTAHEELMAMNYLDSSIAQILEQSELDMTHQISRKLIDSGFDPTNLPEKIHIIIGIIDHYCHEVVYHQHATLNYPKMRSEINILVLSLLK